MATGETILKFTDYPFAYSIIGIGLSMFGFSLGQNQLVFLGLAGAFGTFLATVDPLGAAIRRVEGNHLTKKFGGLQLFKYPLDNLNFTQCNVIH